MYYEHETSQTKASIIMKTSEVSQYSVFPFFNDVHKKKREIKNVSSELYVKSTPRSLIKQRAQSQRERKVAVSEEGSTESGKAAASLGGETLPAGLSFLSTGLHFRSLLA